MGRVIGIDYGDKRCGVAVSDPSRIIATAHRVISNAGMDRVIQEIAGLCRDQEAECIVLGWPLNMDGTEGPATEKVRVFLLKMKPAIDLPIETWDERLTTRTAESILIEAGTRRKKRKGLVDKIAAQVLLQHYLDSGAKISKARVE